MWPWEHLAVGYLLYSLWTHASRRRPPSGKSALVIVVATQFPDLVDKPLSWLLGLVPGHSVAHSLFIAGPLVLFGMALAGRYDRPEAGAVWAIGYLSHLLGDVFSPRAVVEGDVYLGFLFWPLASVPTNARGGFVRTAFFYAQKVIEYFASPMGAVYLLVKVVLLSTAFAVWASNGYPGADLFTASLSRSN